MLKINTSQDKTLFLETLTSPHCWCRGERNYLYPVVQPMGLLYPSLSSPAEPLCSSGFTSLIPNSCWNHSILFHAWSSWVRQEL